MKRSHPVAALPAPEERTTGPHGYKAERNLRLALFLLADGHTIGEATSTFGLSKTRVVQCLRQALVRTDRSAFFRDAPSGTGSETLPPFIARKAAWIPRLRRALRRATRAAA